LSDFVRAWYVFVGLALLTFAFTAFVGQSPATTSAAIALPQLALQRIGVNLRHTSAALTDRRDLRAEVERLRLLAIAEQERVRFLEQGIADLERLLEVRRSQSPAALLSAPVLGRSVGLVADTLTIGVGRDHGIARGMPVTTPDGLVGIVTDVTARTTVVRTILDPQSRVGVAVRGKGGQGVAVGVAGDLLRVERFIAEGEVAVGDLVETSAVGGLFPRGVRVGTIEEVLPQDPNELRRTFLVRPEVPFALLRDVVVIAPP
jgi:rod shape-determining protein MreC